MALKCKTELFRMLDLSLCADIVLVAFSYYANVQMYFCVCVYLVYLFMLIFNHLAGSLEWLRGSTGRDD